MIKIILWYLKKRGYDYTIQNKKYLYINCPDNSVGITQDEAITKLGELYRSYREDSEMSNEETYLKPNLNGEKDNNS